MKDLFILTGLNGKIAGSEVVDKKPTNKRKTIAIKQLTPVTIPMTVTYPEFTIEQDGETTVDPPFFSGNTVTLTVQYYNSHGDLSELVIGPYVHTENIPDQVALAAVINAEFGFIAKMIVKTFPEEEHYAEVYITDHPFPGQLIGMTAAMSWTL